MPVIRRKIDSVFFKISQRHYQIIRPCLSTQENGRSARMITERGEQRAMQVTHCNDRSCSSVSGGLTCQLARAVSEGAMFSPDARAVLVVPALSIWCRWSTGYPPRCVRCDWHHGQPLFSCLSWGIPTRALAKENLRGKQPFFEVGKISENNKPHVT